MQRLPVQRFGADSRGASGPFRANAGGEISQVKPWAKLSWPLRATDWNVQIAQGFSPGNHPPRTTSPEGVQIERASFLRFPKGLKPLRLPVNPRRCESATQWATY
jgi:hypothetical protein